MGLQKMTREHIGLCLFLKIPFFIILTKIDLAPQNKYEETLGDIKKILKNKLLNKFPILMNDKISKSVTNLLKVGIREDSLNHANRDNLPHLSCFQCYQEWLRYSYRLYIKAECAHSHRRRSP